MKHGKNQSRKEKTVRLSSGRSSPKYLAEYNDLFVEKINKKNVRVICKSFPNEHWNISPVCLRVVDEKI